LAGDGLQPPLLVEQVLAVAQRLFPGERPDRDRLVVADLVPVAGDQAAPNAAHAVEAVRAADHREPDAGGAALDRLAHAVEVEPALEGVGQAPEVALHGLDALGL